MTTKMAKTVKSVDVVVVKRSSSKLKQVFRSRPASYQRPFNRVSCLPVPVYSWRKLISA